MAGRDVFQANGHLNGKESWKMSIALFDSQRVDANIADCIHSVLHSYDIVLIIP